VPETKTAGTTDPGPTPLVARQTSRGRPADPEDPALEDRPLADQRSSSPAAAEADSSFGEMSFDMDALEETMKKYD
jgi:hypothetical protein